MTVEEIIGAIADMENTEPDDLDMALEDWIDTDAIHQLVNHDSTNWILRFETRDHFVTVTGEDEIIVDEGGERTF